LGVFEKKPNNISIPFLSYFFLMSFRKAEQ